MGTSHRGIELFATMGFYHSFLFFTTHFWVIVGGVFGGGLVGCGGGRMDSVAEPGRGVHKHFDFITDLSPPEKKSK